jgi:membrane protein DedA with SNARE-associated domain
MKLLINFLDFLMPYGTLSYFVIFGVLLACGFGFPMPEDIILVTSGILAARHIINLEIAMALCMAGVLMGDGIVFSLGRYQGHRLRNTRFFRWILPPKRDELVKSIFQKNGDKFIFMARFMPGLRTPMFFAAGTYKVTYWKFFLLDGFAALISVPLWVYVGYLFGANLEELEKVMRKFQHGFYLFLVGIILLVVVGLFLKKRFLEKSGVIKDN